MEQGRRRNQTIDCIIAAWRDTACDGQRDDRSRDHPTVA